MTNYRLFMMNKCRGGSVIVEKTAHQMSYFTQSIISSKYMTVGLRLMLKDKE